MTKHLQMEKMVSTIMMIDKEGHAKEEEAINIHKLNFIQFPVDPIMKNKWKIMFYQHWPKGKFIYIQNWGQSPINRNHVHTYTIRGT